MRKVSQIRRRTADVERRCLRSTPPQSLDELASETVWYQQFRVLSLKVQDSKLRPSIGDGRLLSGSLSTFAIRDPL